MTHSEKSKRNYIDELIIKYNKIISTNVWRDYEGNIFSDKYKILNQIYVRQGKDAVIKFLQSLAMKSIQKNDKILKKKLFFPKKKHKP
mgnify:CR=1 FL=1